MYNNRDAESQNMTVSDGSIFTNGKNYGYESLYHMWISVTQYYKQDCYNNTATKWDFTLLVASCRCIYSTKSNGQNKNSKLL